MSEVTDPDLLKQLNAAPPDAPKPEENVFLRGGRGVARGAAGIVSSVGDVLPSFGPANPERGKALREFATAPTEGAESVGQFAGSVAPFMVAPELAGARAAMAIAPYVGRLAPSLIRIANSALKGGAAGGAQPTQSGTAGSHLDNAVRGAEIGVGTGLAGALMSTPVGQSLLRHAAVHGQAATIAMVMRYAGLPAHMLWAPWTAYRAIRDYSPLTSLAGRAGSVLRRGAAPAGAAAADEGKSETKSGPDEKKQFQDWKSKNMPKDSGEDYDQRGAYKAGATADPETGHWPDTFKKPNHPTFSDQSKYATGADRARAGHWEGDVFVPAATVDRSRKGDLARIREERNGR